MSSDTEAQTQVLIAIATTRVTRIGVFTVHPSIERSEDYAWTVTAPSGGAVGKFATRAAAEQYAKAIDKLGDWSTHPVELAAAIPWALEFYAKHREAIELARCAAWRTDAWERA